MALTLRTLHTKSSLWAETWGAMPKVTEKKEEQKETTPPVEAPPSLPTHPLLQLLTSQSSPELTKALLGKLMEHLGASVQKPPSTP